MHLCSGFSGGGLLFVGGCQSEKWGSTGIDLDFCGVAVFYFSGWWVVVCAAVLSGRV